MQIVHVFDLLIVISYFAIPLQIVYFTYYLPLQNIHASIVCVLFSVFIVGCGFTHLFHVIHNEVAAYIVYGITAVISLITAVALVFVIPRILELPVELEKTRKAGVAQKRVTEFTVQLLTHTVPVRDPQLYNVTKHILRKMFPRRRVQVLSYSSNVTPDLHVIASDYTQKLAVDESLYIDHIELFSTVERILEGFISKPQSIPGVDRVYSV